MGAAKLGLAPDHGHLGLLLGWAQHSVGDAAAESTKPRRARQSKMERRPPGWRLFVSQRRRLPRSSSPRRSRPNGWLRNPPTARGCVHTAGVRKSFMEGKRVSGREEFGGRGVNKKEYRGSVSASKI